LGAGTPQISVSPSLFPLRRGFDIGQQFEFRCPQCGYRVTVSGGKDCGIIIETQTMTCKACQEVVDVMVGFTTTSSPPKRDKTIGHCPECNSTNVTPWGKGRPCPKCGKKMTKGMLVRLWD
jgi:hypothetical protein